MSAPPSSEPIPIAVLISGGGTTLRNLLDKIAAGELAATVKIVVSSTAKAGGLEIAVAAGIPTEVVARRTGETDADFSERTFQPCRSAGVELVCMGGYLKHVLIPSEFSQRVINIHPSLIPSFCGAGMFGRHVHAAVLAYGAKVSGCTVHYVDQEFDHGPIILQRTVDVKDDDTPDSLAARVFVEECIAYPAAIQLHAAGKLRVDGRVVRTGQ